MHKKKQFTAALMITGTIGLAAPSLFAQTAPGAGPSGPGTPGQTVPNAQRPGPTFPTPDPTMPQTQPGVPRPAPGLPQSKPVPGQPTPGSPQTEIPGQPGPIPGQPGTIPEQLNQPMEPTRLDPPAGTTGQQKPNGARLEGERQSIVPPEPRSINPQPGQSGTNPALGGGTTQGHGANTAPGTAVR
jgi:hypothetical protein